MQQTFLEIGFWVGVWLASFCPAVVVTLRDGEYRDHWHVVYIGCTSGFFTFFMLGIWSDRSPDGVAHSNVWYIAWAVGMGLTAKHQDRFFRVIIPRFLRLGIETDKKE